MVRKPRASSGYSKFFPLLDFFLLFLLIYLLKRNEAKAKEINMNYQKSNIILLMVGYYFRLSLFFSLKKRLNILNSPSPSIDWSMEKNIPIL